GVGCMFRSVRLKLIGTIVAVLGLTLIGVGVFVYALLTRQLDEAIDSELERAASRAIIPGPPDLAPGSVVTGAAPAGGIFVMRFFNTQAGPGTRVGGAPPPPVDTSSPPIPVWTEVAR